MSNNPRCSVILTCYNEGDYIEAAIDSVLSQTRQDLIEKIVISDDGSVAATVSILQRLAQRDSRIEIIYGNGGLGLPANRNLAASHCHTQYLAILDGDDIWAPTKLEKQIPFLDRDERVGLVYSDYSTFPNMDLSLARRAGVNDITKAGNLARTYFFNDPPIIPSTILLRKMYFDLINGFDPAVLIFEDTDFYLRLARVCKFSMVNEPLLFKRNRESSITGGRSDLMAHHAFVAFKFAAIDQDFLPEVPLRLAERARKLGNHKFLIGDEKGALLHLSLARKLNPFNMRAQASWIVARFFPGLAHRLMFRAFASRRAAIGVQASAQQKN